MITLRRLSLVTLALGFGQVVFGAIVRITGSGMGCGEHWPRCQGYWFPPFSRVDLVIEVMHRYFAATLSVAIIALLVAAGAKRFEPGVGGGGGVLRPTLLAALLVIAAALFGAVTVKLALANPYVIVTHLAIAMALLGAVATAAVRAGGLGATAVTPGTASGRTERGAIAALGVTFVVLVLGALTAHIPGANSACPGFPLCGGDAGGGASHVQMTHRIVAFLLAFHLIGLVAGVTRRREAPAVVAAARVAVATVVVQIAIAAVLVTMHLPALVRSLHQAVGTFLWLAVFVLAALARRGARATAPHPATEPATARTLSAARA